MESSLLGPIIYSFFEHYLKVQKGLRPASIKSYRDTVRLFLRFVASDIHRPLSRLALSDLSFERALSFLAQLETQRHNQIRTRNQRLAALHCLFEYLASRSPEHLQEAQRVAAIVNKRTAPPETFYLERDEINALFAALPATGELALRDRALLLFLYNTGARVQEVSDLRVKQLDLESSPRVHLLGKGGKWRVCPLWKQTATLLNQHLHAQGTANHPEAPVFSSRKGQPLTRFGIYKMVRRSSRQLTRTRADMRAKFVSPHIFRHSTAVHMLEAGVEVNVIRAWLGHVSLDTTNRYAEISLRMKEDALKACQPPTAETSGLPRRPAWRTDQSLLEWLKSL